MMEKSFNNVEITFVNEANNTSGNVVIFQKNIAPNFDEIAVAWRVIQNHGHGWAHRFDVSPELQIGVQDSWGNALQPKKTEKGKKWNVVKGSSVDALVPDGAAAHPEEIEIKNCLEMGSINALVYRNEKLMGIKTGISPQQKAIFRFKPTIWIGVVPESITEGDIMNSAVLANIHTEISLLGMHKARLVMSGGGNVPLRFEWVLMG